MLISSRFVGVHWKHRGAAQSAGGVPNEDIDNETLKSMQENIQSLSERMSQVESMLKTIAAKFDVKKE